MIKDFPPAVGFFSSGPFPATSAPVDSTLKLMEKYCPGLVDEMTGFCETAGFPLEKLAYLAMTHIGGKHCSHFAVLPQATANGHVLIGRNYDFSEKVDDLKLTTIFPATRVCQYRVSRPCFLDAMMASMNMDYLSPCLPAGYRSGLKRECNHPSRMVCNSGRSYELSWIPARMLKKQKNV